MIDGFMTAEEIKPLLGLKSRPGDLRTLNKYVKNGKLEVFYYSKKIKVYRPIKTFTKKATIIFLTLTKIRLTT